MLFRSLLSVDLPQSVAKIGSSAFNGCSHLRNVRFKGNQSLWNLVVIESGNDVIRDAKITFNAS